MKKSLIFVGLLAISYANAQEGNVGINTENPKATLEVLPNSANLTKTTNEGIIAPKLTKARIAGIADANLVEGTLVYATDTTYTGTNTKVSKITEKGYYFYNGTEWVKVQHTDTNTELWAQRDNNGVTETYLKPAESNSDEYSYSKNRSYIRLGNIEADLTGADGFVYTDTKNNTPHSLLLDGTVLPTKENAIGPFGKYYPIFSREYYKLDNTFSPATTETPKLRGKDIWFQIKGLTKPTSYAIGQNIITDFQSSVQNGNLISLRTYSTLGDANGVSSPTTYSIHGTENQTYVYSGKATIMTGTNNVVGLYGGSTDNIFGESTTINTSLKLPTQATSPFPTLNIKGDVIGNRIQVFNKENTTAGRIFGLTAYTTFENASNVTTETAGVTSSSYIRTGSSLKNFAGFISYIDANGAATVEDLYAFRSTNSLNTAFQPTNMYGIHLADVNKGTAKNYAIYTNAGKVRFGDNVGIGIDTPSEKLEVNGAIKVANTTSTCTTVNRGTIKFENDNFYGCKSTGWVLLNN